MRYTWPNRGNDLGRSYVMKDGFVQQIGTPQEVFNRPANLLLLSACPKWIPLTHILFAWQWVPWRQITCHLEISPEMPANLLRSLGLLHQQQMSLSALDPSKFIWTGFKWNWRFKGNLEVSELISSTVHLHATDDGNLCFIVPATEFTNETSNWRWSVVLLEDNVVHLFDKNTQDKSS